VKTLQSGGVEVEPVLEEMNDRTRQARNIVIYNLPESGSRISVLRIEQDYNLAALIAKVSHCYTEL
ncbi:hypothetical protein J6590_100876, partial [Homalodisca vitripennis]